MTSWFGHFRTLFLSALVIGLMCPGFAQTYKVGGSEQRQSNDTPQNSRDLGWGSNIQNARLARAAEQALKNGNYSGAVDIAERAARQARTDPQMWFLLGYAARLARKPQVSIDAYNHGLQLSPSSLEGMSGLAQTYSIIGRREEAERLLNHVLLVNPQRTADAALLGEIVMQSGQYDRALSILGRIERSQPSARSEVLMALCYEHLKQFEQANTYLEAAKRRAPNNPDVQRTLGAFYRMTGNYAAAIAVLKSLPHKTPEIMAELAYTYQLYGRPNESAKLYAEAADVATGNLDLQLSAAQAEVTAGTVDHAQRFIDRAASLDGNYYRLHAIRGEIASLDERNQEAVREYEAAVAHLPPSPPEGPLYGIQLHMDLFELYRGLSDDAASHRELEMAQSQISALDERGPERSQFLRLRALIEINSGDLKGAGSDIEEALASNGNDANSLQLDGDLLVKFGRLEDATAAYKKILEVDPTNRLALTSLGYVSREAGRDQDAEKYFQKLAAAYPHLSVPFLALGDMYTSQGKFANAEVAYKKAYEIAPNNALVVAGGMNAAIEAHQLPLAADWLKRATPSMEQNPRLMLERERYLSFAGDYRHSAAVGEQTIKKLPLDRDAVVYLGYDLLHLERYNELLQLTAQYDGKLTKEPDIPLLAGYVHKHSGQLEEARLDFTRALERDGRVPTAYVNRGFVLNDLHQASLAAADFESALKLEPNNGEAHLGLAYASLTLHRPRVALWQVQLAQEQLGDSLPMHLIRATAYGEAGMLTKAVAEYKKVLAYSPDDPAIHLSLGSALYGLHRYREAISELQAVEKLSPTNYAIYAQLARSYARLQDKDNTLANVRLAEQQLQGLSAKEQGAVLISTGEALNLIGDHDAAMERFGRALVTPDSDRVGVRLAIAELMMNEGELDDARRQIALALLEARAGETLPPTPEQWLQTAEIFLGMHDFQLAAAYFQQAAAAGAADTDVSIGLANVYLAEGDSTRAEAQISSIRNDADSEPNYQYLMAKANVYRQQHQNVRALTAFAQAADAAGEDQTAERELMQAAGDEGLRLNRKLSFLSDFSLQPIYEDTTVYPLDAQLDVVNPISGRQGLLPLPRSSVQTEWTGAFHLHLGVLPDGSGFFQIRNARGQISVPSANSIVNRDTTDYSLNFGLNPTLHLADNVFTFNGGVQTTVRRDSRDPLNMNQNLFRQFLYMSTSSFFNMVSVNGYAIHEAGPFTEMHLHSRDLAAAVDFRVGRPWGRTAMVTGWGARDEQFRPTIREFYYTSAYLGIEHRFSECLDVRAVAEDVRSWRVDGNRFAIAQALRPVGSVQFSPTHNWSVDATVAYSRNMGFHAYDAVQSGFSVSYAMPFRRIFKDEGNSVELRYPIRFSAGMQQEEFFNFTGGSSQHLSPYVRITLF